MSNEVSTKDLHSEELTVRLTSRQKQALTAVSEYNGIPRAVLMRIFISRGLDGFEGLVDQKSNVA